MTAGDSSRVQGRSAADDATSVADERVPDFQQAVDGIPRMESAGNGAICGEDREDSTKEDFWNFGYDMHVVHLF